MIRQHIERTFASFENSFILTFKSFSSISTNYFYNFLSLEIIPLSWANLPGWAGDPDFSLVKFINTSLPFDFIGPSKYGRGAQMVVPSCKS